MRIYRFVYVDTLDVPIPILFNTPPSLPELINHKILIMIKKEKKRNKVKINLKCKMIKLDRKSNVIYIHINNLDG